MIRIGSKYNAFGSTALLKSLDDKSLQQARIQHCSMCMLFQSKLLKQRANCKKLNSEFITRKHSVTRNQYTVLPLLYKKTEHLHFLTVLLRQKPVAEIQEIAHLSGREVKTLDILCKVIIIIIVYLQP